MFNINSLGMIGISALLGAVYAVIAYLIGSIPTGYLIVKAKTGQDIREVGSGSTGATNVKRVLGKKWFFIVMLLDAIKGALPVVAAGYFSSNYNIFGIYPVIAAVFVIIGHSKPVFLGGKGGKSVASGVGTILALNWQVGLILAVIWSIIYCAIAAVYVTYLHRENIKRLMKGEENKVR